MNTLLWPVRGCANGLGLAWWAKVQTEGPDVTYWYGPFLRRSTLERHLPSFLEDLNSESPGAIRHELLRTRRGEPFTEGDIGSD